MSGLLTVGIGEYAFSDDTATEIKTYGLGSCVAVMLYDWRKHVAGMIHVAYPESTVNTARARTQPGYFADTGMKLFISEFVHRFAPERRDVVVKLVGGASMLDESGRFNIGKRNALAVKRELWNVGYAVRNEELGGTISRTVTFSVGTGDVTVSNGQTRWTV